jgi:tRNA U34 2-thiouridine synthase MnmA/TrmU
MRDFLAKRIPEKIGNICDTSGQILGTHTGVYRYTI